MLEFAGTGISNSTSTTDASSKDNLADLASGEGEGVVSRDTEERSDWLSSKNSLRLELLWRADVERVWFEVVSVVNSFDSLENLILSVQEPQVRAYHISGIMIMVFQHLVDGSL